MSATKERLPSLTDLQPENATSTAIRAAFYRLKDARAANDAEIVRLEAARPGMLMNSTPAEIDRVDEEVRRRRIRADQLDLLEVELRRTFTIAKEREDDAEYEAKLAELKALEAAWNADVRVQYPILAAQITALMQREADLVAAYNAMRHMPAADRLLSGKGETPYHLMLGMQKAFFGGRAEPSIFGDLVALPSIAPGDPIWRGKR
jgi:transposase